MTMRDPQNKENIRDLANRYDQHFPYPIEQVMGEIQSVRHLLDSIAMRSAMEYTETTDMDLLIALDVLYSVRTYLENEVVTDHE